MDHFQWIVALTRIMSAVFRKGGDVTFLVDEMKAVFDPRGGYFKAGGVYMPSHRRRDRRVVEEHLKSIGMIVDPEHERRAARADRREARGLREPQPKKKLTLSGDLAGADAGARHAPTRQPSKSGEGASFPPTATHVPQVQHQGAGADGRVPDLLELRVQQVRMMFS